jgi:hypothetical protein
MKEKLALQHWDLNNKKKELNQLGIQVDAEDHIVGYVQILESRHSAIV